MDNNEFRNNLVKRRKELGLTQEMLAQRLNVSAQAVSKWEKGSYPDPALFPRLARALNTSIDALFGVRNSDPDSDILQQIHDRIQSIAPDKRPGVMMQMLYAAIYAYNPSFHSAGIMHGDYYSETYAGIKTDFDIALMRLNSDLRYFLYLEMPEEGADRYFTNMKNMARLFSTLSDKDAIRIVLYLGSGRRSKMQSVQVMSKKLGIAVDKVQRVIDRLDLLGLVWRVCVDTEEGEWIMYGYTHNQALTMILVLAESICNYFKSWDPNYDVYSFGFFADKAGEAITPLPEVTWWEDEEKE